MSSAELKMIRKSLRPIYVSSWLFAVPRIDCKYSYRIAYCIFLTAISLATFFITYGSRLEAVKSFNSAMIMFYISSQILSFFSGIGVILLWFTNGTKSLENVIVKLAEIDVELKALDIKIEYRDVVRRQNATLFVFFFVWMIIIPLNEYIMNLLGTNDTASFVEMISLSISTYVPHLNILLAELVFSTIMHVIYLRFEWINQTLRELSDYSGEEGELMITAKENTPNLSIREESSTKVLLNKIERLYKVHQRLCEITEKVSSSFAWLLYLGISVSFILAIYRLIVLYSLAFQRLTQMAVRVVLNITWVVYYSIKFWIITLTCCDTSVEANRLGIILHGIDIDDVRYHKRLHEFSVQLYKNRLNFTAGGFFHVDRSLVGTLISNLTTFILVFLDVWNETEEEYRKTGT